MRTVIRTLVALTAGLAFLMPTPAWAPNGHIIFIADDEFHPDATRIPVAHGTWDIPETWRWCGDVGGKGDCEPGTQNPHNIREDHKLFYSGTPVEDRTPFNRKFSAGTFHYYCEVHGSPRGGMDGVVRVDMKTGSGPEGLPFAVRWASPTTRTGRVFDVHYRVGNRPWETWKTDTSKFSAVFGKNGNPEPIDDTKEYDFQARSQRNAQSDGAVSRWSPVLEFNP
jgi:plastocyanin